MNEKRNIIREKMQFKYHQGSAFFLISLSIAGIKYNMHTYRTKKIRDKNIFPGLIVFFFVDLTPVFEKKLFYIGK
jgi:hypothetical protein